MKIVLDTNVLVSGIFWKGVPGEILDYWAADKISLAVSENILKEYIEVIQKLSPRDESRARYWLTFLQENLDIIIPIFERNICRDPDDNKFINCALSVNADYIVSGDDDLISLHKIERVIIVNPSEYLKILNDYFNSNDKE